MAQDSGAYCNLTDVRVERLSNAVQLTIEADGLISSRYNTGDYFNLEAVSQGDWSHLTKKVTSLPFSIVNARSKVPSIIDIGVYPVSHIEVGVRPSSTDGVGLDLKVVLFAEAVPVMVRLASNNFSTDTSEDVPKVWIRQSQDQRSIVILITSDRAIQKPIERKKPGEGPTSLSVRRQGGLYSVCATNASLNDVASELSKQGGRDIVVDSELQRSISMNMPDAQMAEILSALAMTYGLNVDQSGPNVKISEARADQIQAVSTTVTERIPMRHIAAASAQQSLPEFLLRHIHVDVQNNGLTVTGSPEIVEKVKADVLKLDRPLPQIAIDAVAVEFGNARELETFISLAKTWTDNALTLNGLKGDLSYQFEKGLPSDWVSQIRAVDGLKKVKIQAKPTLVVRNGEKGSLFVGRQQLVKYQYYDFMKGMNNTSIMKVNIGASLDVAPVCGSGGTIMLAVEPSLTTVIDLERGTGLPTVSSRTAKSSVRIESGDTLVIGGLAIEQDANFKSGAAANRRNKAKESTQLVWFVTARVIEQAQPTNGTKQ